MLALAAVAGAALSLAAGARRKLTTLALGRSARVTALRLQPGCFAPLPGLRRMFGVRDSRQGCARAVPSVAVATAVTPIVARTIAGVTNAGSLGAVARLAFEGARRGGWIACAAGVLRGRRLCACAPALGARLRMTSKSCAASRRSSDGIRRPNTSAALPYCALAHGAVERTRDASFVVVNPTHVAIALRYVPPIVPVPEVLVRATDEAARTVRAIAERERIPIVENAALARWLFRSSTAGQAIPEATFVAVAEVVAALIRAGLLEA